MPSEVETRRHASPVPSTRATTFSLHARPLSHRRRFHRPPVRRQPARGLSRRPGDRAETHATNRAGVQLLRNDFRAAARRPEPYRQGAHLHAGRRVAVCRPSHRRHRARARRDRRHSFHRDPRLGSFSRKVSDPFPSRFGRRTASPSSHSSPWPSCPRSVPRRPARNSSRQCCRCPPPTYFGGAMPPESVSCGTPFLFVPLRDRGAVGAGAHPTAIYGRRRSSAT